MNGEKKLGKKISKLFEVARILEIMPRALWVEDVDNVVSHMIVKQNVEE